MKELHLEEDVKRKIHLMESSRKERRRKPLLITMTQHQGETSKSQPRVEHSKNLRPTKEDEVCLKLFYEEDDHEVTMLSYKNMFKISEKLIKENDDIKN